MTAQTYEAWRISYQSSEQAARAAFSRVKELEAKVAEGKRLLLEEMGRANERTQLAIELREKLEAQQERKPLPVEKIDDLAAYHGLDEFVYEPFARAIEHAHGIGVETK